jgi:hypothetical protein
MALTPPILTDRAAVKSVPEMVNTVPTAPDEGANDSTGAVVSGAVGPPPPPQAEKNKARQAAMNNCKQLFVIFMLSRTIELMDGFALSI